MSRTHLRDGLVGLLLVATGAAGLAWQLEGPPSARAAAPPLLVCPLGAHGSEPAPFPRLASRSADRVVTIP